MSKESEERYDLENLPIREEVRNEIRREKLTEMAAIDLIHTVSRMQGVQDDYIEGLVNNVLKEIKLLRNDLKKRSEALEKRVEKLEKVA